MSSFHGCIFLNSIIVLVLCCEKFSFTYQHILEMLRGLQEKRASVHVSILSEQDSRAREELEFRARE